MRVALFLATLLLTTPAMAQYQPYYPPQPDLSGALDRARSAILNSGGIGDRQPVPQYQITPAPFGSYDIRGTNGSRATCSRAPFGGYDCR
jgi:hypothetical protein